MVSRRDSLEVALLYNFWKNVIAIYLAQPNGLGTYVIEAKDG